MIDKTALSSETLNPLVLCFSYCFSLPPNNTKLVAEALQLLLNQPRSAISKPSSLDRVSFLLELLLRSLTLTSAQTLASQDNCGLRLCSPRNPIP